jgi:hypothetical protein
MITVMYNAHVILGVLRDSDMLSVERFRSDTALDGVVTYNYWDNKRISHSSADMIKVPIDAQCSIPGTITHWSLPHESLSPSLPLSSALHTLQWYPTPHQSGFAYLLN